MADVGLCIFPINHDVLECSRCLLLTFLVRHLVYLPFGWWCLPRPTFKWLLVLLPQSLLALTSISRQVCQVWWWPPLWHSLSINNAKWKIPFTTFENHQHPFLLLIIDDVSMLWKHYPEFSVIFLSHSDTQWIFKTLSSFNTFLIESSMLSTTSSILAFDMFTVLYKLFS